MNYTRSDKHKVTIEANAVGVAMVKIDGQEVPNVSRIRVDLESRSAARIELTLSYVDVEVNAESGDIRFDVAPPQGWRY